MEFSSVAFLFFFLPFVWALYFLSWRKSRDALLLLASVFFYMWAEKGYVFVLALSILVNYAIGLGMEAAGRSGPSSAAPERPGVPGAINSSRDWRKILFITGIVSNLALLATCKYLAFFLSNLNALLHGLNVSPAGQGSIHTPLGISFFTFHALSYLVDIHRGERRLKNPAKFALYMALFPKILAGPILQYHDAEKQLDSRNITPQSFLWGIERFIIGLAKKVLIANPLAGAANEIFAIPADNLDFGLAWLGIACFTLQIYFDFSGYSDMAIGIGKTFGFDFPENFNYPYISQSVQEFWRRWHISLSRWFRDYLYIPLGGNRCGTGRQYFNLVVVFLLCGLWHGANWTFILWGLWYGFFLVLERTKFGDVLESAPKPLRRLYVLYVVVIGWVFFRSESLTYGMEYLRAMFGLGSGDGCRYCWAMLLNHEVLLCLALGAATSTPVAAWLGQAAGRFSERSGGAVQDPSPAYSLVRAALLSCLFLLSCISLAGGTHNPFIYFKF